MNLYQTAIKLLQARVEELEAERQAAIKRLQVEELELEVERPSRREHLHRVRQNQELNNCRRRAMEELDLLEAFLKNATSRVDPLRDYVSVHDVRVRLSTIGNILRRAY